MNPLAWCIIVMTTLPLLWPTVTRPPSTSPAVRPSMSRPGGVPTMPFRVPNSYLPRTAGTPGYTTYDLSQKGSGLFFEVLLPDFTPPAYDMDALERPGWQGRLLAHLDNTQSGFEEKSYVDRILALSHLSAPDVETTDGCEVYTHGMVVSQQLHVCRRPDHLLVFECSRRGYFGTRSPYCEVKGTVVGGLDLTYDCDGDLSDQAIAIDDHVRRLVKAFADEARPRPR